MFSNFNILALSLLSATALAVPTPAPQAGTGINDPAYSWSVTGWSAGCARSGCYYGSSSLPSHLPTPLPLLPNSHIPKKLILTSLPDFNISAPAYNDIPAFSAYCSGGGVGAALKPCGVNDDLPGNRGVAAHLLEAETGSGAHIEVSLQWTDLEHP